MPKYPYRSLQPSLDRDFRNDLNQNFLDVENDFKELKNEFDNAVETVSTDAFNKVVNAAKIEWLPPVNTFGDLTTTYPDAAEGKAAMARDSGKVYRMNDQGQWTEIQDIDPSLINEVDQRLDAKIDQKHQEVTAQLAEKATKGEISVFDIDKNKGKFDQTYMTDEFLQQIAGTTPVNAVPADESITTIKMAFPAMVGLASKNLFNKDTVTYGKYVQYSSGNLVDSASHVASDWIKCEPSTEYTKVGSQQLAFYDADKNYISGLSSATTFTTPANCYFMRITVPISDIDLEQLEKGSVSTEYETHTPKLNKDDIRDNTIEDKKLNFIPAKKKESKNLIDLSKITTGRYVSYLDGLSKVNEDFSHTDYIEILPNTDYTLSNHYGEKLEQLAFYDSDKNYISGISNSSVYLEATFTTPSNANFIRVTLKNIYLNYYQLEQGNVMTDYSSGGHLIRVEDIEKFKISAQYLDKNLLSQFNNVRNVITVKQDGSGDFISLRDAIESINDASESNQYEIQIHEGIYDIMSYYTDTEINDSAFIGLQIPNFVHLKGIGNKENIILKGELSDTFSTETMNRVSTLCTIDNCDLENLTVTAKNLRYAVHDDYNYPNHKRNVRNCDFIKYTGGGFNQAYGQGSWSGTEHVFENCYFYTEMPGYAYSFHNNVNFTKPSKNTFINCTFESTNNKYSIKFGSMGSGQKCSVHLVGNKIQGIIHIKEEQTGSGVGIDFVVTGYGNDVVPVEFQYSDGGQYTYNFTGETKKIKNASSSLITKGTLVKVKSDFTGVEPMLSTDDTVLFYGIAMEDININEIGIIRIGGYLQISDTNLSNLTIGDKIGISNGDLAVVTSGDYIGVVVSNDFIKLN